MPCSRIAKSCTRYVLYLHSGMDILSPCFLRLVQDAPALPVCSAFVATATILPGVNSLEPDVPLKPRCRTAIHTADSPYCSPCIYITCKSTKLRTESHAVVPVLLFLSRRFTAFYGHPRSRLTSLLTLCLHYSQV